jgi:nucleotide-binding universal stress UspA family protein
MKKNILVPIDFTEKSFQTLEQAYNLAKLLDSEITLLHVRQDTKKTFFFSLFSEEETNEMKKKYLEKLQLKLKVITEEALKKHKVKISAMLSKGRTFDKIVEMAETVNAELIVIDKSTGESNAKDYIGTNASRIVRQAQCPVLINNNYDFSKGIKTIILPIDLTEGSRQKVSKAAEIAKECDSEIKILAGIFDNDKEKKSKLEVMLKQVEKYLKERDISFTSEIIESAKKSNNFPSLILDYSKKHRADLIIIMTQQEEGWVKSYMSSNALEIIRNAKIPVLAISPKDINFVIHTY